METFSFYVIFNYEFLSLAFQYFKTLMYELNHQNGPRDTPAKIYYQSNSTQNQA